eukprot:g136.t1
MFLVRSIPSNFRISPRRITPTPLISNRSRLWVCSASNELDKQVSDPSVEVPSQCSGCGVRLQQDSPDRPGYLRIPKSLTDSSRRSLSSPQQIQYLVCERCYSLKYYGKLKSKEAEEFIPHFSVESVLKPKLQKTKGRKIVIVCVVDLIDFEASLPHDTIHSLFPHSNPDFLELIIVGNKIDLLPKTIKQEVLEIWVRTRLKEFRLPPARSVHLISSHTLQGVGNLMAALKTQIRRNTDCYIIGMQNAGKSSMLNALNQLIRKHSQKNNVTRASNIRDVRGTAKATELTGGSILHDVTAEQKWNDVTAAFLPGTTLGFVKVNSISVGKSCRVYDTPGLQQSRQVTSRLTLDELKLVQPKRTLKPRTYRFGAGHSLLIGALARLDLITSPSKTLYATIWTADTVPCYLGKTDNVEMKLQKHAGEKLVPPIGIQQDADFNLGLLRQTVEVSGDSWKGASTDICIGGLGWVAVGCQGKAEFDVWTWKGVQVKTRPALLKKFATEFQKPGFSDYVK